MAYIFHEDELPKLISVVPGRERPFFVDKELTKGTGVYLGPSAGATIQAADGASFKLFHLIVRRIPA